MSQFGGSKNPPWSSLGTANPGAHHQVLQAQPLMGLSPSAAGLYNQQMAATAGNNTLAMQAQMQASAMQAQAQAQAALQPQAHVMSMQQPLGAQGMAVAVTAPSSQLTVSYPSGGRQSQTSQPKQRVFMGTVTKLHDTFGFLDEDVFFQTSTVKGVMPKVGEKVLVEATFNPNMPFKWNATRVQPLPNQVSSSSGSITPQQLSAVGVNQIVQQQPGVINPPPLMGMGMHNQQQGILGNPPQAALNSISNRRNDTDRRRIDRNREREERERERMREQQERDSRDRKRERDHREQERKEKEREKERDRSPVKRRSRSPRRSPKRARKSAPRYVVQVPRFPLDISNANVLELRKRYTNLYIPSDFFLAGCSYQEAFPLGRPFNTAHPCNYHMMSKDVEPVAKNSAVLEPPDVSYLFSAKVMLLASVSEEEFFRNCCARVEDSIDVRDNFQHPARILSFLVGSRGKNEVMAIGGPWSPSLDGPDPANDKSVLIRTAIRTTKALTGIDLSACGQWYRFLEIRYHRGEQKGRLKPRVETVVIFVPDVWNLMPTKTEWESLSASYKKKFLAKYNAATSEKKEVPSQPPSESSPQATPKQQPQDEKASDEKPRVKSEEENQVPSKPEGGNDQVQEGAEEEQDNTAADNEPKTPWNDLDPKTMKVQELREELESRGLNFKGLKTQLVARLTKAIKKEEEEELAKKEEEEELAKKVDEKEEEKSEEMMMVVEEIKENDEVKGQGNAETGGKPTEEKEEAAAKLTSDAPLDPKEAEEKKKKEEKEKVLLERKYTLPPDTPSILVHPSTSAKGGKFECTITNLSVLLDYRPEDTKEHSFEVSLFAELFNELLQRDFAFNIYQAILKAPEKKEEKKEEKKDKKEKKDEKEKKEEKKDDKEKKDERKEDKKEERKDEKKDEENSSEEPKTKKRKVEDKETAEEQPKAEEKKDESKDKKPDSTAIVEDGKKEEKKKEEKANKIGSKNRSSSQENLPKGKIETLNPSLLLSCVYFDQNHCGFILDKDLEDLLNCLGLNLSRAQVRKLMHKVLSRDTWHYRKMTDGMREKDKEENSLSKEVTNGPTLEEPYRGNLSLMESIRGKSAKLRGGGDIGMVTFQGAVVDLSSVMSRLKRSEHQRKQDESKITQLLKESDKWKTTATSSQESVKSLNLEMEILKKKLHEADDSLRSSKRKNEDFRSCIEKAHKSMEDMSSRFKVLLEREDRKEKDKDKKATTSSSSSSSEKKETKT